MVGEVRVVRRLDPGLDDEAVKAAKKFRFKPFTKDGEVAFSRPWAT